MRRKGLENVYAPPHNWILWLYGSLLGLKAKMTRGLTDGRVLGFKFHMCTVISSPDRYDQNVLITKESSCITESISIRFILAYSSQLDRAKYCPHVLHSSDNMPAVP